MSNRQMLLSSTGGLVISGNALGFETKGLKRKIEVAGIQLEVEDESYTLKVQRHYTALVNRFKKLTEKFSKLNIPISASMEYREELFAEKHYIFAKLSQGMIWANKKAICKGSGDSQYVISPKIPWYLWAILAISYLPIIFKAIVVAAGATATVVYGKEGESHFQDPSLIGTISPYLGMGVGLLVAFCLFVYLFNKHFYIHRDSVQNKLYKPLLWPTRSDRNTPLNWEQIPFQIPEQDDEMKEILTNCYYGKIEPFVVFHESDIKIVFENGATVKKIVFINDPIFCYERGGVLLILNPNIN